jgi:predicted lipid carrier protein YhbT
MATAEECRQALDRLAARSAGRDPARRKAGFDRTLSCQVRDLDVVFTGKLKQGLLTGIEQGGSADAQIRLTLASDDLIKLVNGELNAGTAWATGRLRVDASMRDMMRLRSIF